MAARPQLQRLARQIAERGGDDYIFDMIADGLPLKKIAAEFGFERKILYAWMDLDKTGGRKQRLKDTRREKASHSLVEDGHELLEKATEDPTLTSQQIRAIEALTNYKLKLAEAYNREEFGKGEAQVNVQLPAEMLLSALQAVGTARQLPKPELPTIEAEVVEDK